jgi:large subunit ribosomal protein L23
MTKKYRAPEALKTMQSIAAMKVVVSPIITEKSTRLTEFGQYAFKVDSDATKFEIKAAVEMLFGVKVEKVNTINVLGKTKRFRGRIGYRSDFKKAIVTLSEGQTIDLSVGV